MADVKHRNPIRIATTTQQYEQEAIDTVLSRELLYNRDNKTLGIVLEDEDGKHYRQIVSGLVDEVNITKNENFETKLKEDIIVDSVTTQADHEGVDWKSQSLVAKTSAGNTILLLFKQDNLNASPAVIGGEILEVGEGIFGHYQVSLTQTGSRLIKGATTTEKKAKYVLCMYNGERYYGIKFKSELAANIYFAGWQSVDESLRAPAYTEYEDSDLSDIIELDDDSDTGTQVIDYEFIVLKDYNWEFTDAPVVTTVTSYDQTFATKASTMSGTLTDNFTGGSFTYYYSNESRYGIHFYTRITGFPGTSTAASHTITSGNDYLIVYSSGLTGYVTQSDHTGPITFAVYNPNSSTDRQLRIHRINADKSIGQSVAEVTIPRGSFKEAVFELEPGEYYFWQTGQLNYYSIRKQWEYENTAVIDSSWKQNGNNSGYDLNNGLVITTENNSGWKDTSIAGDAGYIFFSTRNDFRSPAFTLPVFAKATITVGFTSIDTSDSNVRLTETLDTSSELWRKSVSVDSSSPTVINEVVYHYDGELGQKSMLYILNENGGVNIAYIRLDYDDIGSDTTTTTIINHIENLGETGDDGSPHIIRLSGDIKKETILALGQKIRETSSKQIVLDLSQCTMESLYTDWSGDTELSSAFLNCIGLREFYYPQGVTSCGKQTFQNCQFLREVHFNKEITSLGDSSWSANNNSIFAGARLKAVFMPKSVTTLNGYVFSNSNIIKIYWEKGCQMLTSTGGSSANELTGAWNTWEKVKNQLVIYFEKSDYDRYKNITGTFKTGGTTAADANMYMYNQRVMDHVAEWENYSSLKDPEFEIDYTA